jgi:hypothetical protein
MAVHTAAPEDTTVILVHGVGLPGAGLFGTRLADNLRALGIAESRVVPVDWHTVVESPIKGRLIDVEHLKTLMRAFLGAAARDKSPNVFHTALELALSIAPLLIVVTIALSLFGQRFASALSIVATYWVVVILLCGLVVVGSL